MIHLISLFLFILLSVQLPFILGLYEIVHHSTNNKYYLIVDHLIRDIYDGETLWSLLWPHLDTIYRLRSISSEEIKNYEQGSSIQLRKSNNTQSDLIRFEREKNNILQGRLYQDVIPVGDYMNPSIVKWQGRYLMANAMTWGKYEGGKHAKGIMNFKWLNVSDGLFHSTEKYLCISSTHLEPIDYVLGTGEYHDIQEFRLEDPRLVVMNDTWIHIVVCTMNMKHIAVATVDLHLNLQTQCAELKNFMMYRYDKEIRKSQKNWSPFQYQNRMLYVQSINPMVIVQPTSYNLTYRQVLFNYVVAYSKAPYNENVSWPYGHLRGGTNCLRYGNEYISFFHSFRLTKAADAKTYVMGAYTFSAEPPFRLLRISPLPIMLDEVFYTGQLHVKYGHWNIDYVIFPTTIMFDGPEDIVMSFGYQDSIGYLTRFNIKKLLHSLMRVGD